MTPDESGEVRSVKSRFLNDADLENLAGAPVFDGPGFDGCIIEVRETSEGHVAVYDYDLLWQAVLASSGDESGQEQMVAEHAIEHVDFNLVRSLPYMRPRAPFIGMAFGPEEGHSAEALAEEFGEEVETFVVRGVMYVRM